MKPTIRDATRQDTKQIIDLLCAHFPDPPAHWARLFLPRDWQTNQDCPGLVLEDAGQIVGFFGVILHQRLANMTTWLVHPDYRQYSIPMLSALFKRWPDVTWTNLTPSLSAARLFQRFGFKTLSTHTTLLLPIPSSLASSIRITINPEPHQLKVAERVIHRDHAGLMAHACLIEAEGERAYCLLTKIRRKRLPVASLHYTSHPALVQRLMPKLRFRLCAKLGVVALIVDKQLCPERRMIGQWTYAREAPSLYRAAPHTLADVNTLYSEVFVLGL